MEINFVADKFELRLDPEELIALEEALDLAAAAEGQSYLSGQYTELHRFMADRVSEAIRR